MHRLLSVLLAVCLAGPAFAQQTVVKTDNVRAELVSEVSEDAGERAEGLVREIVSGGPIAVREAKRLVRERPTEVATAHIAAERRTSDEGQDGLQAFLERRPAGWLD